MFARTTALSTVALPSDSVSIRDYGSVKLSIRNLSKTYIGRNGAVNALSEVTLDVREGEFVCVLGPSGCGKTTLLNMIANFDKPDSGSVRVANVNRSDRPQKLVIFQEPSLFPWLNVVENVEFGLKMVGVNRAERLATSLKYLNLVGMERFSKSYIHELSGGMKQRVALARALALDPEILLMDEPFAALDVQTRRTLQGELLKIWAETGKTVLFITHNIEEALYLADRIFIFTPHPGTVRREFDVSMPKPRNLDSSHIRALEAEISGEFCQGGFQSESGI